MAPAARTFHGLVRAAAQAHGSAPALVEGDRRLTWAELSAQVDRTAAGWAGLGMAAGDRVAVQLPNGVDWVLAVVGALRAGLVVVPVAGLVVVLTARVLAPAVPAQVPQNVR